MTPRGERNDMNVLPDSGALALKKAHADLEPHIPYGASMNVTGTPPLGEAHSARYVWYVIVLLSIVNLFNYMDRMMLAMLVPSIKADLQLSDAQLGLLIGLAFSLFYAVCGIPIARLADTRIRRNVIAIAVATWSVATAFSGAAQNFWHLFIARVAIGMGEAGGIAPSQSMICDYVPLQRRSGFFAIHNLGSTAGIMLGMALAGWLGEHIGWRWAFAVVGIPGIALAIIVRFTLREPKRGNFDAVSVDRTRLSFNQTVGILWRCKTYRLLTVLYALNGFVQYGLNQWWPSFFGRVFGLSLSSVGIYLGIAIGAGSGVGLIIGGLLANRAAQRDISLPLMIGVVAVSLAVLTALGSLFASSAHASILLVSLTALLWSVPIGPIVATATGVVESRMRTTAAAINILFSAVLGFGLGPFCVGLISDMLTPSFGNEALRYALLAPICLLPVMAIVLYAATKSLQKEARA